MELFLKWQVYARRIGRNFARKRSLKGLDSDCMENVAEQGLWDALARFDRARGFGVKTFVFHRIMGAMRDEGRRMDHLPRMMRLQFRDKGPEQCSLNGLLGEKRMEWLDPQSGRDRADIEARELVDILRQKAPARVWHILALYFLRGLTLRQVGEVFGLSESRVSQMLPDALRQARAILEGRSLVPADVGIGS